MPECEHPQLYLISPPQIELSQFPGQVSRLLDVVDMACMRLDLATRDEDRIARAADVLRDICHGHDGPLVIGDRAALGERLGLDGVHLKDGAHLVRKTRKALGPDAIIGAFCGATRHDGINAAEAGADYVSFGPVGATQLGGGGRAGQDLFAWWSEMIEVPVVAEGALDIATIRALAPLTDFFAIGEEIWNTETPQATLMNFVEAMRQGADGD